MAGPELLSLGTLSAALGERGFIDSHDFLSAISKLQSTYTPLFRDSATLLTSLQYDLPGKSINVPTLSQLVAVACINEFKIAVPNMTDKDFALIELKGGTTCLLFNTDSGVQYVYGWYAAEPENGAIVEIKRGTLQQLHLDLSGGENEITYEIRPIKEQEREHVFKISNRLITGYFRDQT